MCPHGEGRAQDRAQDDPHDCNHGHREQHRAGEKDERGFDVAVARPDLLEPRPGDDALTRPVDEERDTNRDASNRDEEKDNADHCAAGLVSAANASWARRRLAAIAASRAFAFFTQSAASGLALSGRFAMSASAAAVSACAASMAMRAV